VKKDPTLRRDIYAQSSKSELRKIDKLDRPGKRKVAMSGAQRSRRIKLGQEVEQLYGDKEKNVIIETKKRRHSDQLIASQPIVDNSRAKRRRKSY
jgi:hypothetical protein